MEFWTDEQLISDFQHSNNPACLAELYQRYQLLILGISYQVLEDASESEDLLNEVFIKLIHHKQPIRHFRNWVYTATKHLAIDKKRKRTHYREAIQKASQVHEQQPNPLSDAPSDGALSPGRERQLKQIKIALHDLPIAQRQCLELFFLQEKTYKEIQTLTGMPLKTIKSHLQNGKRRLRLSLIRD
ncbi:MAG: sigma-70 family RNA polymerase sigma factor [Bacteroidota bacterium]